jgi:hypothetical protein
MAPHHELLPPASLRLRTRLAHIRCGFCGCREAPDETGRIITIPHAKQAICELCIDEADLMADCARRARRAPKAKRRPFRRINSHRIGG